MANQTGVAIVIKAFLPTGKSLDEQFNTLSLVKAAHESGDYTEVLKAAQIDEVKAEQKTRRVGTPAANADPEPEEESEPACDPESSRILHPEPQPTRSGRRGALP